MTQINALMRIQVRVQNQASGPLKQVQNNLNQITAATVKAQQAQARMGAGWRMANLERNAKNLQWVGRQIEFNFTLPLVLAGAAASRWAMQNEAAFTTLKRVYGGANADLTKLQRGFLELSNIFGMHQSEVIEIGAAWAQAGYQGYALANATRLTMETMVIGQLNAADATQALLVLMQQFNLTTDQAAEALHILNIANIETSASFGDLITAMTRAGGVAVTAGIDIQHLAAMTASLVPITGSAQTAGNGLKTIISRLMSPTKDAAELMGLMGINMDKFMKVAGSQRIETLAVAFDKLSDSQKNVVSAFIAGRFQINRFDTLMRDIIDPAGNYRKVLGDTANKQEAAAKWTNALTTVLKSQPQAFKILTTQIQNALAQAILPLIPAVLSVFSAITRLATSFANLDPEMQKIVLVGLTMLALVGPLARYIGAFGLLISTASKAWVLMFGGMRLVNGEMIVTTGLFSKLGGMIIWVVTSPFKLLMAALEALWGLLAAWVMGSTAAGVALVSIGVAAVALAVIFRKQIGGAIRWVADNFNRLPGIIANAMLNIVRVVAAAAMMVYHWLSYLNPFARHSPSLVDQVTAGVREILDQYAKLRRLSLVFQYAADHLKLFMEATKAAREMYEQADWDEQRVLIVGAAGERAGHLMDTLTWAIRELRVQLKALETEIVAQSEVVDQWARAVKAADAELKTAQRELDRLRDAADSVSNALDAAKSRLDNWLDTPIVGMRAMSDLIFENEMAQKRLRLEMMNLEDSIGPINDVSDALAALEGQIETARSEAADLRQAGAGSDVLATINGHIAELEAARQAMQESGGSGTGPQQAISDLQKQLDALERQGERLDLENSLQFDPLTRQIEQTSNAMREMPFDAIIAGIQAEQANVARLTDQWNAANAAVDQQQAVVDALQARRDAINETYDAEQQKLSDLKQAYSDITSQIQDMEQAINSLSSSASAAQSKKASGGGGGSLAAEQFGMAEGGDFAGAMPMKESGDLDALIKKWEEESKKAFGDFNILDPVKKAWNKAWAWAKENISFPKLFGGGGSGPDMGGPLKSVSDAFKSILDVAQPLVDVLRDNVGPIFEIIGDKASKFASMVAKEFKVWWTDIGPPLMKFLKGLADLFKGAFDIMMFVIKIFVAETAARWAFFAAMFKNILGPVLDLVIALVKAALQIIRGIIVFVLGMITGDWGAMWKGILTVLNGVWDAIIAVLHGAISIVIGIFKGLWEGVVNVFTAIWDFLFGHSIIPDIVQGFVDAFNFIKDFFIGIFNFFKNLFTTVWNAILTTVKTVWEALKTAVTTVWNWIVAFIKLELEGLRVIWDTVWNTIKTVLTTIWEGIKSVVLTGWNFIKETLGGIGGWLKEKVTGAFETVAGALDKVWGGIKTAATSVWGGIKNAIIGVIRTIVSAINVLINGMNAVGGAFNKISPVNVPHIKPLTPPEYAKGGLLPAMKVGAGAAVKGARAIVGEGSRLWDEYVIPTDPKYKRQAQNLWGSLTQDLFGAGTGVGAGSALPSYNGVALRRANSAMTRVENRLQSAGITAKDSGGDRHVHLHGDLVLPNITSGDDAEKLIRSLESLVTD